MRIAIIAAMQQEVEILRQQLTDCQTQTIAQSQFYSGKLAGHEIMLLQSGIGKVAAAAGTALLLQQFAADLVINTGSAGGLDSRLNVGDIVLSTAVAYHDVDVTAFGYQPGQMAGCPPSFVADEQLQQLAQQAVTELALNAVSGLIVSGDAFIHRAEQQQQIRAHHPSAIAVEMEAAAIGHVCWLFAKPFIVVRAISDVADKASVLSFEEFLPLAAKQSSAVVKQLLSALAA